MWLRPTTRREGLASETINTVFIHLDKKWTYLQREPVASRVLVKVVEVHVVNDWLVEHREVHLLCQLSGQCGLPSAYRVRGERLR